MVKFSIIVPIYRVEDYIDKCIESIISQKYKNIEIILVDDASPDRCPDICDKYALTDDRIKVLHKKNGGPGSARKAGAKIATGDYICCIDGDDFISQEYIQDFYNAIENNSFDVICMGYTLYSDSENKKIDYSVNSGEYSKKMIEKYIFPNLIAPYTEKPVLPTVWAKAFKRDIFLKYQMQVEDNILMGEDGALTIPLICNANSIKVIKKNSYFYRVNQNSLTKGHNVLKWDSQESVVRYIEQEVKKIDYSFEEQMNRRIVKSFFSVAKSQFNKKEKYSMIKKDILEHINNPYYSEAIKKSKFGTLEGKVISLILKNRIIIMLYIINKFK